MIIETSKNKTLKITFCKEELYVFASLLDRALLESGNVEDDTTEMIKVLSDMTAFTLNS